LLKLSLRSLCNSSFFTDQHTMATVQGSGSGRGRDNDDRRNRAPGEDEFLTQKDIDVVIQSEYHQEALFWEAYHMNLLMEQISRLQRQVVSLTQERDAAVADSNLLRHGHAISLATRSAEYQRQLSTSAFAGRVVQRTQYHAMQAEVNLLEGLLFEQLEIAAAHEEVLTEVLLEHGEQTEAEAEEERAIVEVCNDEIISLQTSLSSTREERDRQVALCIGAATAFVNACFDDLDLHHAAWPTLAVDADVHALYGWLGELTSGVLRRASAQKSYYSVQDKYPFLVRTASAIATAALRGARVAGALPQPPTTQSTVS
jgi:hypothetical protein